jgi:type I restriction enzyme R subunit
MSTAAVHTERALEDSVEAALLDRGWIRGTASAFDRKRALDPTHLFAFLEESQPKLWAELRAQHGTQLESAFLAVLEKYLDSHGTLGVLRQGIKFYGKKIELAYFRPAHGLNPEAAARYAKNRLVVTRQVRFIPDAPDSIDLVLFLYGRPVATAELKNHFTGQNVWDAVAQYKRRDPRHPVFRFAKCVFRLMSSTDSGRRRPPVPA